MSEVTGGAAEIAIAGSGWLVMFGKMAWSRFFSKESKGNDALIQQLTDRIKAQEDGLMRLNRELDLERRLRRLEQSKVHSLVLYIIELKSELRKHGIEVPASASMLHDDTDLANLLGIDGEEEYDSSEGAVQNRTE